MLRSQRLISFIVLTLRCKSNGSIEWNGRHFWSRKHVRSVSFQNSIDDVNNFLNLCFIKEFLVVFRSEEMFNISKFLGHCPTNFWGAPGPAALRVHAHICGVPLNFIISWYHIVLRNSPKTIINQSVCLYYCKNYRSWNEEIFIRGNYCRL